MADAGRDALDWTIPETVPEAWCGFTVNRSWGTLLVDSFLAIFVSSLDILPRQNGRETGRLGQSLHPKRTKLSSPTISDARANS